MRRRNFLRVLGGAAAWPLAARAQQGGPVRRIGVLMNNEETDPISKAYLASFVQGLRKLGWIEGQTLGIEVRWNPGDAERARSLAGELLRLSPEVILASSTANLVELLRRGPTMPIVFVLVSDPVEQGFVSNLAHPGGNITGFSAFEFSIGKWIELLKQVSPGLAHVALVFNPDTSPQSKFLVSPLESAARSLAVEATVAPVHAVADIERAIETVSRRPNGGLIFPTDSFLTSHRQLIVESAARHRVPAIYGGPPLYSEIGGLISYAIDFENQFRQAAVYIDRILKGAKPGDLPVQSPTKYSFIINVKTAKALGIEVPMTLLLNADEVIE